MTDYLSPRQLAEAIGVSESSVKRWADEGLIVATRTAGGHRRIARQEAIRFIRDCRSPVARPDILGFAEVAQLSPAARAGNGLTEALYDALLEGRLDDATGLIHGRFLKGDGIAALFDGPIRTVLARLGELWRHREDGILIEHRATDLCLQAIVRIRLSLHPLRDDAPTAVGGGAADDPYLLPTMMAAAVLQDVGVRAINLGPQTPCATLAAAVTEHDARLAWLSVSAAPAADALRETLPVLGEELADAPATLMVGGRATDRLEHRDGVDVTFGDTMSELSAFARGMLTRRPD